MNDKSDIRKAVNALHEASNLLNGAANELRHTYDPQSRVDISNVSFNLEKVYLKLREKLKCIED